MNVRVPVKCIKILEENGGFAVTVRLPPAVPGKDRIVFNASNEMTYQTHDRAIAEEVATGDTMVIALFTSDHKES